MSSFSLSSTTALSEPKSCVSWSQPVRLQTIIGRPVSSVRAVCGVEGFAADCRHLQPRGSIKAPSPELILNGASIVDRVAAPGFASTPLPLGPQAGAALIWSQSPEVLARAAPSFSNELTSELVRVNVDCAKCCGRFTVYASGRSATVVCWAKSLISSARDLTSSLR